MPGFPERFRALRGDQLTQQEVAGLLGIALSTVGKWEGGRNSPTGDNLVQIANLTGASTDYLLGRSDEFEGPPKWWLSNEEGELADDGAGGAPGPGDPDADLEAGSRRRQRGDERRVGRSRQRRQGNSHAQ